MTHRRIIIILIIFQTNMNMNQVSMNSVKRAVLTQKTQNKIQPPQKDRNNNLHG
uniref:Uncharacterized protein n=1 Tax=virus sp. ctLl75 TaxID=2828249 RepID=A0A8S5RAL3_9VIRU|nr:MAG TPA: hypothetical protein [virus sp. ctLl75]